MLYTTLLYRVRGRVVPAEGQDQVVRGPRAGEAAGGPPRPRGVESFIIKVIDDRELLDERIPLRCSVSVAPRPLFARRDAPAPEPTSAHVYPFRCPDRASSPEITATSPDVPAGGMARTTTHERYLGRHRSSQSEELTTNGASPRRGAHPKMTN